eukprot:jgi/Psemu1/53169/gm1.53169_g
MLSPGETVRNRDRDRNSSSSNSNSNSNSSNSQHHQMGRFSSSLYCGIWAMCLLVVCQIGLKSQPMEFHSVYIDAPREKSRDMAVRLGVVNSNSNSNSNNDYSNNDYNDNDDNDNDDNGNDTTNGLTTAGSHSPPLTDNRPWMVVHVGPPKTGTTTIQQGLFKPRIRRMLARQDNVYYVAARMISSNSTSRVFLPGNLLFPGPNSDLKKVLREHQQAGHNVLISSEHFTSKINARRSSASWRKGFFEHALLGKPRNDSDNDDNNDDNNDDDNNDDNDNDNNDDDDNNDNDKVEDIGPFRLPRRLQSQPQSQSQTPMEPYENQEPFFGFRVKIVVTYRHFFDWITSQHHQRYLRHGGIRIKTEEDKQKTYTAGIVEYIEDYLRHAALDDKDDDLYGPKEQQQQLLRDGNDDFINDSSARGAIAFREALSILPEKRMADALYNSDGAKYNGLSGSLFAHRKFLSSAELYDRVDVIDMHQQPLEPPNNYNTNTNSAVANANGDPGLLANFVCQSLPAANRTCAMLRHDALAADGKRRHNTVKRSRNNSLSGVPSSQDMSRVLWHLRWKLTDLFDPTVRVTLPQFSSLVLAIDKWFEGAGNGGEGNGEGNGEPREVPKICLEGENLERLKKLSLDYLAEMYRLVRKHSLRRRKIQQQQQQQLENNNGNNNNNNGIGSSIYEYGYHGRSLFRSSHSRDHLLLSRDYDGTELPVVSFANNNNNNSGQAGGSLPLPEHIIAAHNAEFDRYVAKGKYCQLDLEPLLSDPVFVDYVTEPLRHWDERNYIAQ